MKKQYKKGVVYWVMGFTAPKVFDGENFHCLLTDQVISCGKYISAKEIKPLSEWEASYIYKPERFNLLTNLYHAGERKKI
jgi:hypothetical protein